MIEPRELTERYRLERILKSGRTGTVLRAVDLVDRRQVAIKLSNLGADPLAAAERFLAVAGVLEGIDHAALPVVLYSGVTTDGSAFLALELVDGRSFAGLAGTSHKRMVSLAVQALGGLEALAQHGLVHGNLSPDNLLVALVPQGASQGQRAYLLGLGTALFRTPAEAAAMNETARFRAPEELAPGAAPADFRADLYSLARVVAEVLGAEITHAESPAPQVALPFSFELEKADALRAVLERCLRRDPAERPGSHEEVRRALRLALGRGFVPEPPAGPRPKRTAAPATVSPPAEPERLEPAAGPELPGLLSEIEIEPLPALEETAAEVLPGLSAAGPLPGMAAEPGGPGGAALPPGLSGEAAPLLASPRPQPPPSPGGGTLRQAGEVPAPVVEGRGLAGSAAPAPALPTMAEGAPPTRPLVAPPPSVAPEPALQETGEPASVLPEIDFASLEAPPPPPPPPPEPEPVVSAAPPPPPLWRRPAVFGGAAAGLLLAGLAGWWLFAPAPPPPAPAPGPARPAAPPLPPPAERFTAAEEALARGDYGSARQLLASLSGADQRALPPGTCARLQALEETARLYADERLPKDLAAGLESGAVPLLRQALATLPATSAGPASGTTALSVDRPELAADVARARSLVALYDRAEAAANEGRPAATLEAFAALAPLLPKGSGAFALRERAAAALEAEAETRIRAGEYAAAAVALAPLSTHWPDRPGLADRLRGYRELEQAEKAQEALLATAPRYESRRKPDEGLAVLRAEKPTPHLEARFAEAVGRLEAQLAELDRQPPAIELGSRYDTQFFRGTVANLGFRVTDDYKVAEVRILATPAGGRSRELPYEKQTQSYVVEIPPSLHNNEAITVVAVATDLSGHETRQTVELTRVGDTRPLVR